jgi:hypothetical protein
VEAHHDAVTSHVRVGLEMAIPERHGRAERLKRVFGRLLRPTSVRDRDRRRLSEERVQGPARRGRTPARAYPLPSSAADFSFISDVCQRFLMSRDPIGAASLPRPLKCTSSSTRSEVPVGDGSRL